MQNIRESKRFKTFGAVATIFSLLLHPVLAKASDATAGNITDVTVNASGIVFFQMSGTRTAAPSW
ncbi:hypothetical protein [Asticcacaulis sp. 201]|uniref:hypothetical protein n=1 Tax=Asticcacaulis sp. 201 TaxID=3028787 RepID=UPI002916709F|nr:hypothetical protein [Asticcacaulis sp. 201]MDV6330604.1 hypothetical protein [Asticcacaulis sp. 201]